MLYAVATFPPTAPDPPPGHQSAANASHECFQPNKAFASVLRFAGGTVGLPSRWFLCFFGQVLQLLRVFPLPHLIVAVAL